MICESCEKHAAAYWVEFPGQQTSGVFAVCWLCMTQARRGPRPPTVRVITESA